MSKEYVEITWSVGTMLKERLRSIEWEPLPKRLSDLLNHVREKVAALKAIDERREREELSPGLAAA